MIFPAGPPALPTVVLLVQYRLLAHIMSACVEPDCVVHNVIHDRIGMYTGTKALVPVPLRILGTEHRSNMVIATLEEFQQHAAHRLIRMIE